MFNNRCVSSVLFQLFFHITHEEIHDHRPLAVLLTLTPPHSASGGWGNACFFFTLFPAHTFLILILQTASYKNTRMLTDADHSRVRCSPIDSGMLKRPGTRSNRLGPDPDPADHLKYRPEPVRVPGRVPGPRISGPPWRPLQWSTAGYKTRLLTFIVWTKKTNKQKNLNK